MRLLHGAATDTGRVRVRNEDYLGWRVPPGDDQSGRGALFVVADGVGGHAGGAEASRTAVEAILQIYYACEEATPSDAIETAIRLANAAVYAGGAGRGRATTVVTAAIVADGALIAHVGDSRALLVRAGVATQVTEDHSWVHEMVRDGLLTPEEARHDSRRNVISRWMGDRSVEPDLQELPLCSGDRIVLGTDGLTNYVEPDTIAATVESAPEQEAAEALCRLAIDAGGTDNITAIVIRVVAD
jgi:serine/threonine protein phosphatase PrpC